MSFRSSSSDYDTPAGARRAPASQRATVSDAEQSAELTVRDALRTFRQQSRTVNKKKVHNTMPARVSSRVVESRLSRDHAQLAPARVRNNDEHVIIYEQMSDDTARVKIAREQSRDLEMSRVENTRRRRAGERRK